MVGIIIVLIITNHVIGYNDNDSHDLITVLFACVMTLYDNSDYGVIVVML